MPSTVGADESPGRMPRNPPDGAPAICKRRPKPDQVREHIDSIASCFLVPSSLSGKKAGSRRLVSARLVLLVTGFERIQIQLCHAGTRASARSGNPNRRSVQKPRPRPDPILRGRKDDNVIWLKWDIFLLATRHRIQVYSDFLTLSSVWVPAEYDCFVSLCADFQAASNRYRLQQRDAFFERKRTWPNHLSSDEENVGLGYVHNITGLKIRILVETALQEFIDPRLNNLESRILVC